ncbi:type II toxin-antitoxin system ParD family antitoxin [Hyphomicrobium sp.]|uniref:type II toxin-antitoxin system ParD family antitoxin n=1 Tax=Hyphomicrobium sp. TaxID=82 RepID=UPI0034292524
MFIQKGSTNPVCAISWLEIALAGFLAIRHKYCEFLLSMLKLNIERLLMATMTVSLPDPMKAWIETRIDSGEYASSSDYVRDLIRKDKDSRLSALRRRIDDADASGISVRSLDEIFEDARTKARERGLIDG